jgi:hypothetical protein
MAGGSFGSVREMQDTCISSAVLNLGSPIGLLRIRVSPKQAAVNAILPSMVGEYVMVVGTSDITKTDMGASLDSICVPIKYRFEGTFVVFQTNVFVPAPVTPTEYACDVCAASTIDVLKGIISSN